MKVDVLLEIDEIVAKESGVLNDPLATAIIMMPPWKPWPQGL